MDASALRDRKQAPPGTLRLLPGTGTGTDEAVTDRPTVVGGSWQVLARLGGGTFGTVYRASHMVLPEHEVALKLLEARCVSPEARDRALHEVRLLASVSSPYVVQVKEWGWHEDRLYFTMPLYRGCTLAEEFIRREGWAMGERRRAARRMFVPLAHGLAALHRAGLVHQDVKPENVYLAEVEGSTERFPILLDLGVARRVDRALLAGTPRYCAPEVARRFLGDDLPVGPAADVYGLALTLLEWLAPDALPTPEDVPPGELLLRRSGVGRASWRPEALPRDLRPWFARWLAADPAQRPDAATFARELAVLTRPEESRARARWAATRVGVPASMLVLVLVAGLVVLNLRARTTLAEEHLEHMRRVAEQVDHARDHQELSAVNGLLHGRLDDAAREREALTAERDRIKSQRDQARTERAQFRTERDVLEADRDRLQTERDTLQADRDRLQTERDTLQADRDHVRGQRDTLQADRDRLQTERDALQAERDQSRTERDHLQADVTQARAERDRLVAERDRLQTEREHLVAEREQLREQRDQARAEAARRMATLVPPPGETVIYQAPGQPRL